MAKGAAATTAGEDKHRLDKWLWAARFYKTRSLAAQAVEAGKVLIGGERVKPAKAVRVGDVLVIKAGWSEFTVQVSALSDRRGSAPEAAKLYQESAASKAKREQQAAQRKASPYPVYTLKGRPTKRERRKLEQFFEESGED